MANDEAESGPVERCYEMRLGSNHSGDENEMIALEFFLRRQGEDWEPFELSVHGSPFLNFLQSTFLCQLAYLRMNSTERGLGLKRVHGICECDTSDFAIERLAVSFAIELEHGEPTADDLSYLCERCLACPVSQNLKHVTNKGTWICVGTEPSQIRSAAPGTS